MELSELGIFQYHLFRYKLADPYTKISQKGRREPSERANEQLTVRNSLSESGASSCQELAYEMMLDSGTLGGGPLPALDMHEGIGARLPRCVFLGGFWFSVLSE